MSKIRDWLIDALGGYTHAEWCARCYEKDKKHDEVLAEKDRVIMELVNLSKGTPDDCKRGVWCEGCAFAKRRSVRVEEFPYYSKYTSYYCGKAEACKHLLPKTEAHHG